LPALPRAAIHFFGVFRVMAFTFQKLVWSFRSLAIIALLLSGASAANAQACKDPPATESGKCSKQAGAVCDPGSRVWMGGSKQAYLDCMRGKGLGAQLTCSGQRRYCRSIVAARGLDANSACPGIEECLRTGSYRYIGRGGQQQSDDNLAKR